MASITNNHKAALQLPGGVVLNPGVATNVPGWDEASKNAVVKEWVKRKVLTVGEAAAPASNEKAELHARLDELGVEYDKRSGVAKLRDLVAEAEGGEG